MNSLGIADRCGSKDCPLIDEDMFSDESDEVSCGDGSAIDAVMLSAEKEVAFGGDGSAVNISHSASAIKESRSRSRSFSSRMIS